MRIRMSFSLFGERDVESHHVAETEGSPTPRRKNELTSAHYQLSSLGKL